MTACLEIITPLKGAANIQTYTITTNYKCPVLIHKPLKVDSRILPECSETKPQMITFGVCLNILLVTLVTLINDVMPILEVFLVIKFTID